MRKLFSILAVALFALSAHATVVTHNLELSSIASQGEASWSNPTITADAWKGIQYWFGEGESAFDASPYYALVLELEEASSVGVYFDVVYSDGTEPNDVTIAAGQTQGELILLSDQVEKIEIKLRAQGSATLKKLYFKGELGGQVKTIPLVTEEHNFPGNFEWSEILDFSKDEFATAHEGDMLIVTYETPLVANAAFRIKTHYDNTNVITPNDFTPLSGGKMRFVLTESDLTTIASQSSLYVEGKTIKITGIQLRKRSLLWTGSTDAGKWSNAVTIPASKLSDLQIGNIICVRVTDIGSTDGPRVSLFSGWSNSDALVGGEYYFQGDDAASAENPFIVQFPVTGSMKQQLGNKDLLIRGVNYTVTDVYVLEGEPVAEDGVKGYLTVSAAGMATFMLPFNVPSPLPSGVQAYNLTYNGDATIWAEEVFSLTADKPVLIIADAGEYEFVSEEGASDDITSKTGTFTNGALVGTYTTIDPLAQTTGGNYNYILQNGSDGVGFYQVRDASCSVAPYRAYLSCGYNPGTTPSSAPKMRIVFRENTTTGVESILPSEVSNQKVLRNGQLFILRNGVEYNANGQMTK
ncbi:MAG: hypothetical protein IJ718_04850 [Paludibacteraceae bacterium]|nr:hypothetical protein [Paludibacteraceae bacterium]